jgi:hypothetical protein
MPICNREENPQIIISIIAFMLELYYLCITPNIPPQLGV